MVSENIEYDPAVGPKETEYAQAESGYEPRKATHGRIVKAGGVMIVNAAVALSSFFATGEAKADEEAEPIPARVSAGVECVDHPYEEADQVAVYGNLKNQSSDEIEAQHRVPSVETVGDDDIWATFAPGQNSTTPTRITDQTSIQEREVIFYARREGEPEQVVGSDIVGPKDCAEEGSDEDDETDQGGPHAIHTEQHIGSTPAYTAVEVSVEEFNDGEADMAVLATDETFADALAGGPLAEQVGGPILYANPEGLPDVTAGELQRLGTREVLLLGGEDALSRDVSDQLRNMGVNVTRIAGATRFETAAEIEGYMDKHTLATTHEVFLANGTTFADANAVAGLAAQQDGDREAAILLTTAEELHETTRRRLQERKSEVNRVTAVGGTAVIQSNVLRESGVVANAETNRYAGRNRYETSAEVMRRDFQIHGNETADGQPSIYASPAESFHGALAAAPIESRQDNAALALVPESDERLLTPFESVIQDYKHTSWTNAKIVGSVSSEVFRVIDQEILDATPPVNQ